MGEIVNLNRVRKAKAKLASKAKAAQNRSFWGRGKEEKSRLQVELEKARQHLDQHRRDD